MSPLSWLRRKAAPEVGEAPAPKRDRHLHIAEAGLHLDEATRLAAEASRPLDIYWDRDDPDAYQESQSLLTDAMHALGRARSALGGARPEVSSDQSV